MSRREARNHVMNLLFQKEFSKENKNQERCLYYLDKYEVGEQERPFILDEYNGTIEHQNEIDHIITESSKNWKINRMAKLDLTILRLAVYEMHYAEEIPNNVAINEAVELAKKYSGDEAPAFINGVLANVIKKIEE